MTKKKFFNNLFSEQIRDIRNLKIWCRKMMTNLLNEYGPYSSKPHYQNNKYKAEENNVCELQDCSESSYNNRSDKEKNIKSKNYAGNGKKNILPDFTKLSSVMMKVINMDVDVRKKSMEVMKNLYRGDSLRNFFKDKRDIEIVKKIVPKEQLNNEI